MAGKSRGRGAAATFGMLLLLAGIAGAVVLWFMAERRPEQAVDGFARGPVGCTTILEFDDTGRFFVYEEIVAADSSAFERCTPAPTPGTEFSYELLDGGRAVVTRDDTSISYDTDTAIGTSIGWVEITTPGRYELVVRGDDASTVAAVGRDPEEGVDDLRRGSVAVGVVGVVLGGLMLLLAGRRSKRAARTAAPTGPGWGPEQRPFDPDASWPPQPPTVPQVPVNPMLPSEPVHADPEPPAPDAAPEQAGPDAPPASPWAPPTAAERADPPPPPV